MDQRAIARMTIQMLRFKIVRLSKKTSGGAFFLVLGIFFSRS